METAIKKNKLSELYNLLLSKTLPYKQLGLLVFLDLLFLVLFCLLMELMIPYQPLMPEWAELIIQYYEKFCIFLFPVGGLNPQGNIVYLTIYYLFSNLPVLAFKAFLISWLFKSKEKWRHIFQIFIVFSFFSTIINGASIVINNLFITLTLNIISIVLAYFVLLDGPAKILKTKKFGLLLVWIELQTIFIIISGVNSNLINFIFTIIYSP